MPLTRPVAAQIKFDVTNINDPLIRLNSDESGSADKDTGLVFERGSDQNVALIYDESADTFALINTDETGTTSGNVTIASYADLKVNNLQVQGTTTTVNAQTINATNAFVFEGATADDFETTLAIGDPTADRTVTLPDATGTLALTSDIPTAYTSSDFDTAFAAKTISGLNDVEVASTPSAGQALLWNTTYSQWQPGDVVDTTLDGTTSISGDILPNTDNVHDLGSASKRFAEVYAVTLQGTSTSAQYADLAEMYAGDKNYEVGTVVCVGGDKEVTECTAYADSKIAGVVSDKPAYLMNRDIDAEHPVCVGFVGRVPIKVVGHIEKGDLLTSSEIKGYATKFSGDYHPGCIIGLALNDKEDGIDTVEVLLKRS
ncbi:hypothetical protein N9Z41_01975 [bacterium]|nr:hypothetical protein [bacterium]